MKNRLHKAFTLVELLVVIAVLALLLSIITPALSRAREHAVNMVCTSQIRQIGIYMAMYSDMHDGKIPPPSPVGTWPIGGGYHPNHMDGDQVNPNPQGPMPQSEFKPSGLNALWAAGLYNDDDITVNYCPAARGEDTDGWFTWDRVKGPPHNAWPSYPRLVNGQPDRGWFNLYHGYAYWAGWEPHQGWLNTMPDPQYSLNNFRNAAARHGLDRGGKVTVSCLIVSTRGQGNSLGEITDQDRYPENGHTWRGRVRGGNVLYLDGSARYYRFRDMLDDWRSRLRLGDLRHGAPPGAEADGKVYWF